MKLDSLRLHEKHATLKLIVDKLADVDIVPFSKKRVARLKELFDCITVAGDRATFLFYQSLTNGWLRRASTRSRILSRVAGGSWGCRFRASPRWRSSTVFQFVSVASRTELLE